MANASNSITLTNSYNGTFTLSTSFNENSTNIENNTSNITVSGTIARGTGRFDTSYNNMLRVYWHDNKNNTNVFVAEIAVQDLYNSGASATASGTINVEHNSDGNLSGYAFVAWEKVSTASAVPASNSVSTSWTELTYIPRQANITGYNDFNDEQNPTITYNNPGGFRINARLEFGGTNIRRDNILNTGSYTFNLTDDERKLLRQKCTGNSMVVRGVIATCIGGTTENYWSYWDRTMTIVNGNPTFNNFVFEDINETTVALTGNNQNIIKGYSNVQVTIPVVDKAIAKKEATMKNYRFTCGDKNQKEPDMPYSETKPVIGTIDGVPNGTFKVFATDSRNNSTSVEKLANQVIDYSPLNKISIDAYRNGGVSEEVILQLEGTINVVNFGKKTNAIKTAKVKYRVAKTDKWSPEQDITLTVTDGKFSYNGVIKGDLESKGFNISNSYEVEVVVTDELSSVTFTDTFSSGTPNIAYHKNGISVMGKYDVQEGGLFQINGKDYFKYSKEESKIGVWYDNKPIYRKVYEFNPINLTAHEWINIVNISDLNIKRLVNARLLGNQSTSGHLYGGAFQVGDEYLQAYCPYGYGQFVLVIIEYTKTTD